MERGRARTVDDKDEASRLCGDEELEDAVVAVDRRYSYCSTLRRALLRLQHRHALLTVPRLL